MAAPVAATLVAVPAMMIVDLVATFVMISTVMIM